MHRRNFLKSISLSALAIPTISGKTFSSLIPSSNKIIKPKRLKKGDTLGLIAPGSFIKEDELKELKKISKKVSEILVTFASEGKDKAMTLYN